MRRVPVTAATVVRRRTAPAGPRPSSAPAPARPAPEATAPSPAGHSGLAAVATVGGPALWVAALAQAPAGTVRGLVLAAGWVGLASVLDRPRRRHRG